MTLEVLLHFKPIYKSELSEMSPNASAYRAQLVRECQSHSPITICRKFVQYAVHVYFKASENVHRYLGTHALLFSL